MHSIRSHNAIILDEDSCYGFHAQQLVIGRLPNLPLTADSDDFDDRRFGRFVRLTVQPLWRSRLTTSVSKLPDLPSSYHSRRDGSPSPPTSEDRVVLPHRSEAFCALRHLGSEVPGSIVVVSKWLFFLFTESPIVVKISFAFGLISPNINLSRTADLSQISRGFELDFVVIRVCGVGR